MPLRIAEHRHLCDEVFHSFPVKYLTFAREGLISVNVEMRAPCSKADT